MNRKVRAKLCSIINVVFDFDGVMTDGMVWVTQEGQEIVQVSRKDGLGIEMLKAAGIRIGVLSKETNPVVAARCAKLGISCYQGVDDKAKKLLEEFSWILGQTLYMGDDLNDLECIKLAGFGVTVADGHPACKSAAQYVARRKGGKHAVREVCDLLLEARRDS